MRQYFSDHQNDLFYSYHFFEISEDGHVGVVGAIVEPDGAVVDVAKLFDVVLVAPL
jgi:hypothetical protein